MHDVLCLKGMDEKTFNPISALLETIHDTNKYFFFIKITASYS